MALIVALKGERIRDGAALRYQRSRPALPPGDHLVAAMNRAYDKEETRWLHPLPRQSLILIIGGALTLLVVRYALVITTYSSVAPPRTRTVPRPPGRRRRAARFVEQARRWRPARGDAL
jgi:hypothetical protein